MSDLDHVLASIDGALDDWEVSDDAMRWTPDPLPEDRQSPPMTFEQNTLARIDTERVHISLHTGDPGLRRAGTEIGPVGYHRQSIPRSNLVVSWEVVFPPADVSEFSVEGIDGRAP